MRLFLIGAALALLTACRKDPAPLPEADSDSTSMARPAALSATQWLALSLPCGDSLVALYDDTGETEEYIRHKRVDTVIYDSGYFVERGFWEGGDWLYLDKRYCNKLALYGQVLFNPSKTHFASMGTDFDAGFSANGVQIVSLVSGFPKLQSQDEMESFTPVSWAWEDDSTFVAVVEDRQPTRKKRRYEYREGAWSIRNAEIRSDPEKPPFPEAATEPDSAGEP